MHYYLRFGLLVATLLYAWPSFAMDGIGSHGGGSGSGSGSGGGGGSVSSGNPTAYVVQVQKVELCTGIGEGSDCYNPYVAGSDVKSFDIASAAVGGEVGAYVPKIAPPPRTTYSHVRVTISRTIQITGSVSSVAGVGGIGNCRTGGTAASGYTAGTAGTGLNTAGTPAAENLNVPNALAFGGSQPVYPGNFSVPAEDSVSSMSVTYALAQPFTTAALTPPVLDVTFNTTGSLGAVNDGSGGCLMFPMPVSVVVTVH